MSKPSTKVTNCNDREIIKKKIKHCNEYAKNKCSCVPIPKAAYKTGVSVATSKYQTTHRKNMRKNCRTFNLYVRLIY
jgi:hypothetical protein